MQHNWYAIYTKPNCEKKVVASLAKKKIENYFPLKGKMVSGIRKNKIFYTPLFPSYVFVNTKEDELEGIKQMPHVLNLLHWKGSHAIISQEDIRAMNKFCSYYLDIKVEKILMNDPMPAGNVNSATIVKGDGVLLIRNEISKIHLPSMGYLLIAAMPDDRNLGQNTFSTYRNVANQL